MRSGLRKPRDPAQASSRRCGAVYDEAARKLINRAGGDALERRSLATRE